jgi:predicted transcriptional regulator
MGLRDDLLNEPVSSLAISPGVRFPPTAPVRAAVAALREKREGCVIIVDDHGFPEGKFTEHQIAQLIVTRPGFMDEPISRHMRDAWAKIALTEPIANLIHKLQDYRLRYVIVVDEAGKAAGVIGQRALMHFIGEYFPLQVKANNMEAHVPLETREGA